MSDLGLTNPQETLLGHPVQNATSGPSGRRWRRRGATSPARLLARVVGQRLHVRAGSPAKVTAIAGEPKKRAGRRRRADVCGDRASRQLRHVPLGHSRATRTASASATGASNARSAPAQGGASGTVASVSKSSFTMTTSAGQKVTVDEKSSTTYDQGTSSTSAKAVTKGQSVLVLGTVNSTTITATQVVVGYKPASSATSTAKVVPFEKGEPTTAKQVGQIPANWSAGSGTIVSGATANQATEAALAAYPGGIVDRVVKLSNGEYNVHYIGVNWPHHVFESATLQGGRCPLTRVIRRGNRDPRSRHRLVILGGVMNGRSLLWPRADI